MGRNVLAWWVPQIGDEERARVLKVLESTFLNDGEVTTQFEQRLAELLGIKHVVAVTSGTAAIFLALASLGVGPGDEVIVPDVTFIATANAVSLTGATVVLVDIDPKTMTMDPEAFARAITLRTKAVIPVHVSGRAADLTAILNIARAHGIHLVEDAAEALMSQFKGRALGTYGMLGCLSFSPQKLITMGQGGAILTNDDRLHTRLRELKDQGRPVRGTGGDDAHPSVGYNFKLTNLQTAVGLGQLGSLPTRLLQMQETYRRYTKGLQGVQGINLFPFHLDEGESPQWIDALADDRDGLDRYLLEHGAQCRRFWFPLHTQAPYREADDRFPQSTRCAPKALWLPSALTLSADDIARVCQTIIEFCQLRRTGFSPAGVRG